jgi:endonuclease G
VQHPEGQYKQIALRENQVIGRGKGGITLHYAADTLPGSSGSPVYNDQFELVALHHAGGRLNETTLEDGTAVPDDSNEGIRISAIVKTLRDALDSMPSPNRSLLAEALDPPSDGPRLDLPPAPEARAVSAAGPQMATPPAAPDAEWAQTQLAVPVRIALQADAPPSAMPTVASIAEPVATAVGAVERNQPPDPRYERRRGYDADFLCLTVPFPQLSPQQLADAAVPTGRQRTAADLVVAYLHFSVVVNAARRMPFFTAVNIDGARSRGINRQTGEVEAAESWFLDPRLKDGDQLGPDVFDRQRPHTFDRGHMVRRLDPAWGSAETARRASDDTFHFTNCCPQIAAFNQRVRLWAGIENYVLDNAKAERQKITVFTGPLFADDDPEYRGVAVPRAFWKLVVRMQDRRLRCTAFKADQSELLDRALETGVEAFTDLGNVAEFQVSVAQVAEEAGLDFGELVGADTRGAETAAGVQLTSFADIDW